MKGGFPEGRLDDERPDEGRRDEGRLHHAHAHTDTAGVFIASKAMPSSLLNL